MEKSLRDQEIRNIFPDQLERIIAQRRQREPKRAKDLSQCQALIPFIRTEKLQQVMESQRIGKDTKKKILMSCKMIDFDFDRLET